MGKNLRKEALAKVTRVAIHCGFMHRLFLPILLCMYLHLLGDKKARVARGVRTFAGQAPQLHFVVICGDGRVADVTTTLLVFSWKPSKQKESAKFEFTEGRTVEAKALSRSPPKERELHGHLLMDWKDYEKDREKYKEQAKRQCPEFYEMCCYLKLCEPRPNPRENKKKEIIDLD